jgi:predicted transcriptional regulator
MSTTMTIRLDTDIKDQLDRLAEATQRSKSFLAAEAIREYVETNEWQLQEIKAAIAEADAGDVATEAEVKALTEKWNGRAGKMAENSPQKSRRRTHLHRL